MLSQTKQNRKTQQHLSFIGITFTPTISIGEQKNFTTNNLITKKNCQLQENVDNLNHKTTKI